ncbi:MAG: hypothetical protein ACKVU2_01345 [Saprospiraceae bacterium]
MTVQNYVLTLLIATSLRSATAQEAAPDPDTLLSSGNADSMLSLFDAGRGFWKNLYITGGQLTLPFKIRPKLETQSFRLTTDVTVGAYIGLSKRLSEKKRHSITIPFAAGLTFVNLHNGNTLLDTKLDEAEVVPGITWCVGAIIQLEQYSIGLMFGQDYASDIGNQWEHHGQMWWSFGVGFSFARKSE